jgi:hypothetical protein
MILAERGVRIVNEAAGEGLVVRLLGGTAIWLRASEESRQLLGRQYQDLDFASRAGQAKRLSQLLETLGYVPERRFNAVHGGRRLLFDAPDHSYHVDIFLDRFEMSHRINLTQRLAVEDVTLPAAELLLTKLQVAEVNRKDISDSTMLLLDHAPSDEDGQGKINAAYLARLCAADWGLFTTVSDNLEKTKNILPELLHSDRDRASVLGHIEELERWLSAAPKTMGWKMRAKIGRRVPWYETPEEIAN